MSIFSIAYNNFKNNIKTYKMFFISMIFSVTILSNFFILMNGEALKFLGEANAEYTKMILQLISIILGIFILFFIWYASNIFLKNRKKEIGLYTFMGVDSKTIGKIYFLEMMLIGLSSCCIGVFSGVLLSKFFQMVVFYIAGFSVNVKFNVTTNSIISTFLVFIIIFIFMSIKGFVNIVRSKVIDLLNDSRKTERMPKINVFTYLIAAVSSSLILYGYYIAIECKTNALKTLVLVCLGTYGVFYSLIPAILKFLADKKSILYKGENIIAINSLCYRIKKNYTTYATIGILIACTVTVLGTAVSMKNLYTMTSENDNLYSISFCSAEKINNKEIENAVLKFGNKKYDLSTTVLKARSSLKNLDDIQNDTYVVLSYNQLTEILKTNDNGDYLRKINEDMVSGNKAIYIQRPGTLVSLLSEKEITVNDNLYEISKADLRLKTLGSLLNYATIVVNDEEYSKLKDSSEVINFYGIKIDNDNKFLEKDTMNSLKTVMSPYMNDQVKAQVGIYKLQNIAWLKVVYAIGAFLFLVFVVAVASIIYTKIFSDASEDKGKFKILSDIGASKKDLSRAIMKEVLMIYIFPLIIGLLHGFFAIKVLGMFLTEDLLVTFIFSSIICILIFAASYIISVNNFKRVVNVGDI